MPDHSVSLENVGPIDHLSFALKGPGITVLKAPNGSGKSLALDAIQTAAAGKGKVPLRDHTKRGKVEAFGAKITVGGTCRHTGEFETQNLEGRFDIGALIDPKLKSAKSADAARIKALVSLTGVKADPNLFREHEAFENFDGVVSESAVETDDLVEMASRIKRDYDAAAREEAKQADREDGHAAALDAAPDLDLTAESDEEVLQERYDAARDRVKEIETSRESWLRQREAADKARASLDDQSAQPSIEEMKAKLDDARQRNRATIEKIAELEDELRELRHLSGNLESAITNFEEAIKNAESAKRTRDSLVALIADFDAMSCPTTEELDTARESLAAARDAMERGVLIREAKKAADKANMHRELASAARKREERYRDAGRSVDEVLSSAIQCDELRVESDGECARLVADTDRGKGTAYHELSDGERGRIAIDIAAKCVGEGGLVVVSQSVWEELDGHNRRIIHEHAVQRKVYILTAEASQDDSTEKVITPTLFGE